VVNFADQASGRIYLRIEAGTPVSMDGILLKSAVSDPDTRSGVAAVAPAALHGEVPDEKCARYLFDEDGGATPTLGQWGDAGRRWA